MIKINKTAKNANEQRTKDLPRFIFSVIKAVALLAIILLVKRLFDNYSSLQS